MQALARAEERPAAGRGAVDAWLARLCAAVPGTSGAVLLVGDTPEGPWKPIAAHPVGAPVAEALLAAAAMAASSGRPVLRGGAAGERWQAAAAPLPAEGRGSGAVALALSERPHAELLRALGTIQDGVGWLSLLLACAARDATPAPARDALEVVAACLDAEGFRASATAVVTELALRFGCEQVSLGFLHGSRVRVEAVSHSARFDERSQLLCDVAAAMEEALDAGSAVVDPPRGEATFEVRLAHERLRAAHGAGAVCSVPLAEHGRAIGAVAFEACAGAPLDPRLPAAAEPLLALVGPILADRRHRDLPVPRQLAALLGAALHALADPERPGRRLVAAASVAALLALTLVPATYRVSAPARLEGLVQRAVVAAMDGYVAESRARAGDAVRKGDVLAALDSSELELERRKWLAEREQHTRALRAAMAEHELAQLSVLGAKVDQADAQLALIDDLLERTVFVAPFDGIVARGDLSQSLGTPVARGDLLFEVAPLDHYRIILEVDERDVDAVAIGSRGELTLSALPSRTFPLVVERVTPVATAEKARNFFRVEARLDGSARELRPGMEGVGKVEAGSRRLLWIWTHSLVDWLRLWLWARLP